MVKQVQEGAAAEGELETGKVALQRVGPRSSFLSELPSGRRRRLSTAQEATQR